MLSHASAAQIDHGVEYCTGRAVGGPVQPGRTSRGRHGSNIGTAGCYVEYTYSWITIVTPEVREDLAVRSREDLLTTLKLKTLLTLQKPWKHVMTHQDSSNETTRVASDEPFTIHIEGKTELLIVK